MRTPTCWLQPIWKIWFKTGIFPKQGCHLDIMSIRYIPVVTSHGSFKENFPMANSNQKLLATLIGLWICVIDNLLLQSQIPLQQKRRHEDMRTQYPASQLMSKMIIQPTFCRYDTSKNRTWNLLSIDSFSNSVGKTNSSRSLKIQNFPWDPLAWMFHINSGESQKGSLKHMRFSSQTFVCHPSDCHCWLYRDDLHRGTLPKLVAMVGQRISTHKQKITRNGETWKVPSNGKQFAFNGL